MEEQGPAWASLLFFLGFFLIMLIVPWIVAREPHPSTPEIDPNLGLHFTSTRERRLWLFTLVVLIVIYSTMGLTPALAAILRDAHLLTLTTSVFLLLVVVAVSVKWAASSPGRHEIAAGCGIAAVLLMATARTTIPERSHLFEYGLISVLIHQALKERRRNGRRVALPALLAVVATALLGCLDEGIQSLIPNRVYDLDDILVNGISGLVAVVATVFLTWARSLDLRRKTSG